MIGDIAFGASGKIEKFQKDTIGSGKQHYSCHLMFLPMPITGHQNTLEQAVVLYMNRHIGFGQFTL